MKGCILYYIDSYPTGVISNTNWNYFWTQIQSTDNYFTLTHKKYIHEGGVRDQNSHQLFYYNQIFLLTGKEMFDQMGHRKEITSTACSWLMTGSLGMATIRNDGSALLWKPVKVWSEQHTPPGTSWSDCFTLAKRAKFSAHAFGDCPGLLPWTTTERYMCARPTLQKPNCWRTFWPLIKSLSLQHLLISQKNCLMEYFSLICSMSKNTLWIYLKFQHLSREFSK